MQINRLAVSLILLLLATSCDKTSQDKNGELFTMIPVQHSADELKNIQDAVDNGHQPWRLEPVEVALVYLNENVLPKKDPPKTRLIRVNSDHVVVEIHESTFFRVFVSHYRENNGIWYVEKYEMTKSVDSK